MKHLALILLFAFLANGQEYQTQTQNIVHITEANLNVHTSYGQVNLLIEFVHQDSTFSHTNREKFEEIADKLSKEFKSAFKIARILCHKETVLCQKLGVASFPIIKWLSAGKLFNYEEGIYDHELIRQFVTEGWKYALSQPWFSSAAESSTSSTGIVIEPSPVEIQTSTAIPTSTSITKLTLNNFESFVRMGGVVRFYAPWCGFSRGLTPIWEKLAQKGQQEGTVQFAELESSPLTSAVEDRFEVVAYPTIILFHQNTMYTYDGERTVEAIWNWATEGYKSTRGSSIPPIGHRKSFFARHFHLVVGFAGILIVFAAACSLLAYFIAKRRIAQVNYSPVSMTEKELETNV